MADDKNKSKAVPKKSFFKRIVNYAVDSATNSGYRIFRTLLWFDPFRRRALENRADPAPLEGLPVKRGRFHSDEPGVEPLPMDADETEEAAPMEVDN